MTDFERKIENVTIEVTFKDGLSMTSIYRDNPDKQSLWTAIKRFFVIKRLKEHEEEKTNKGR